MVQSLVLARELHALGVDFEVWGSSVVKGRSPGGVVPASSARGFLKKL